MYLFISRHFTEQNKKSDFRKCIELKQQGEGGGGGGGGMDFIFWGPKDNNLYQRRDAPT